MGRYIVARRGSTLRYPGDPLHSNTLDRKALFLPADTYLRWPLGVSRPLHRDAQASIM